MLWALYKVKLNQFLSFLHETVCNILYSSVLYLQYTVIKSLFVLASRQKIPVLRTENPAVDTRTICLPPIEIF